MAERVKNVSELIRSSSLSSQFQKKFAKEIQNKNISKFLFSFRCKYNLTQKQLAGKIRCSQSRISKIESSYNYEVTIKDLLDYAKALNMQLEVGYRNPSAKIVDLIKYHAFKIKYYLEKLTELVKKDETLNKGIKQFHGETIYNLVKITLDSLSQLNISKKKMTPIQKEQIHISTPIKEIKQRNELRKVS